MNFDTLIGLNQQIKTILTTSDINEKIETLNTFVSALAFHSNDQDELSMVIIYNDPNIAGFSVLSYPSRRWKEITISVKDINTIIISDYRHDYHIELNNNNIIAWYVVNADFINRLNLAQEFGNMESRTYEEIKQEIRDYILAQNPYMEQLLNIYSPEKYIVDILASIYDRIQKYIDYAYSMNDIEKAEGLLLEQLARLEYNYRPTPPYPTEIKSFLTFTYEQYLTFLKELYESNSSLKDFLFPPIDVFIFIDIEGVDNTNNEKANLFWNGDISSTTIPSTILQDGTILNDYSYAKNIIYNILRTYQIKGLYPNDYTGNMSITDNSANTYVLNYLFKIYLPTVPSDRSVTKFVIDTEIPYSFDVNGYSFKTYNYNLTYTSPKTLGYFNFNLLRRLTIVIDGTRWNLGEDLHKVYDFTLLFLKKYDIPDVVELGFADTSGEYIYAKEFKEEKETNITFSKSVITLDDENVSPDDVLVSVENNGSPVNAFVSTDPLAISRYVWEIKGIEDTTETTELEQVINTPIIYLDFNRYGTPIFSLLLPHISADNTINASISYFTHSGYIPLNILLNKTTNINVSDMTISLYHEDNHLDTAIITYENNKTLTFKVKQVKEGYSGDSDEQIRMFRDYLPADKFPKYLMRAITNKDYQLLLAQYPHLPVIKSQLVLDEKYVSGFEGIRLTSADFTADATNYKVLIGSIYVLKKTELLHEVKIEEENTFIKLSEIIPSVFTEDELERLFDYLLPYMITSNYYAIKNAKPYPIYLEDVTFYTENVKNFYQNIPLVQEKLIHLASIGQPLTFDMIQSAISYLPYKVEIDYGNASLNYNTVDKDEFYYYAFFRNGQLMPKIFPLSMKQRNKVLVR